MVLNTSWGRVDFLRCSRFWRERWGGVSGWSIHPTLFLLVQVFIAKILSAGQWWCMLFNPSTREAEAEVEAEDLCEFEASLVY